MALVEHRVSYLEGQVTLLPQMMGQLGERLERVEATLNQRIGRIETALDQRIDRVETTLRGEILELGRDLDTKFYWLLFIQMTTFITTLAAILGVFYMRG